MILFVKPSNDLVRALYTDLAPHNNLRSTLVERLCDYNESFFVLGVYIALDKTSQLPSRRTCRLDQTPRSPLQRTTADRGISCRIQSI